MNVWYSLLICLFLIPQTSWAIDGKLVIAHRGASGYLPEHTLEAKALAYGMGADYIEQDVVLSRDDVPVVLHDIYLDTVTDVAEVYPDRARSDGRFYAIDFTVAEIKTLQVTERINIRTGAAVYPRRFPVRTAAFRVPTLAEEIEMIQGLNRSTGRQVGIYPEIKAPAWHREQGKDISAIVLDVLNAYGYNDERSPIFLQCFDVEELKRIRYELNGKMKLVQLLGGEAARWTTPEGLKELAQYVQGIGPSVWHIIRMTEENPAPQTTTLVKDAHAAGLVVHPYTFRVDALPPYATGFEQLLRTFYYDIGVDGIFTDHPDRAVRFLSESAYLRSLGK